MEFMIALKDQFSEYQRRKKEYYRQKAVLRQVFTSTFKDENNVFSYSDAAKFAASAVDEGKNRKFTFTMLKTGDEIQHLRKSMLILDDERGSFSFDDLPVRSKPRSTSGSWSDTNDSATGFGGMMAARGASAVGGVGGMPKLKKPGRWDFLKDNINAAKVAVHEENQDSIIAEEPQYEDEEVVSEGVVKEQERTLKSRSSSIQYTLEDVESLTTDEIDKQVVDQSALSSAKVRGDGTRFSMRVSPEQDNKSVDSMESTCLSDSASERGNATHEVVVNGQYEMVQSHEEEEKALSANDHEQEKIAVRAYEENIQKVRSLLNPKFIASMRDGIFGSVTLDGARLDRPPPCSPPPYVSASNPGLKLEKSSASSAESLDSYWSEGSRLKSRGWDRGSRGVRDRGERSFDRPADRSVGRSVERSQVRALARARWVRYDDCTELHCTVLQDTVSLISSPLLYLL